jgi:formylglycine-generating enzyme required for sulfatase activity
MARFYTPCMSKKDETLGAAEPQKGTVHLTPILGVRPGIYLTVLYSAIFILLVFFLLFYPGLRNRGAYLTVDVQLGLATIKVDGVFAGTAPSTIFVKNGARQIEIGKTFYTSVTRTISVRGRVFATLIVPARMRISAELSLADLKGLLKNSFDDFSRNQTIPQIVSDASWAAFGKSSFSSDEIAFGLYSLVDNCMYFMNPALDVTATTSTPERQLVEILRAGMRTSSAGTFLSVSNFLSFVQKGVQLKEKYDNLPAWLLVALSREHGKDLASSTWMTGHFSQYRDSLSRYYQPLSGAPAGSGGGAVSLIAGLRFRSIPSGVLVMGKDDDLNTLGQSIDLLLPHPVSIQSFYLSETEVTNRQYKLFLDSAPRWRKSNIKALVTEGLVSDDYLSDWTNDLPPSGKEEMPVVSVSWDAVNAYCGWLAGAIRSTGMTARLPSEAEWEWAARGGLRGMPYPLGSKPGNAVFYSRGMTAPAAAGSSEPNGYGLRDMMGNVWEWCGSSFGASDYLLSSLDPIRNAGLAHPDAAYKAVRGGSWNNQRDLIKVYTRGSQPMDWCSPFLGFRVAVVRAGAEK